MPTDTRIKTVPTNLAVSNSGDCKVGSTVYEYAETMTTPIIPTNCGFSVRSHKIPIKRAQNMTIDNPKRVFTH